MTRKSRTAHDKGNLILDGSYLAKRTHNNAEASGGGYAELDSAVLFLRHEHVSGRVAGQTRAPRRARSPGGLAVTRVNREGGLRRPTASVSVTAATQLRGLRRLTGGGAG
jgi:hypothetical protein